MDDATKSLRKWIIFLVIWSMIQTGFPRHETNIDPASVQTMFKYHKTMAIHSPLTAGIDYCYLSHDIFHFIRNFINLIILSLWYLTSWVVFILLRFWVIFVWKLIPISWLCKIKIKFFICYNILLHFKYFSF